MKLYTDTEYKCHLEAADDRTPTETDVFDGKCSAYIRGYRFIPSGKTWVREDGTVFSGETVMPFQNIHALELAQSAYEESLAGLQDMEAALRLLGVEPVGEVTDNG